MTDASSYGVGAVLLQEDDNGNWRPVAFAARKLKGAETRYTVTKQKCLAIVFALRKWRHYLQGDMQFVGTDHVALRWLMSLKDPRGRLARWVVEVQDFDFCVSYAPGSSMVVADCLSRDAVDHPKTEESVCPRCLEGVDALRDSASLPTVQEVLSAQPDEFGDAVEYIKSNGGYIIDVDSLICHEGPRNTAVLVPSKLRHQVLTYMHGSTVSAHFGIVRTSKRFASRFLWPSYRLDVMEAVSKCLVCAVNKAGPPGRQEKMMQYHRSRRFELVAVDIMEISPRSRKFNVS
jgi:RNase H-like domain found in reverse transcriptase/Integrase zinc binding domain